MTNNYLSLFSVLATSIVACSGRTINMGGEQGKQCAIPEGCPDGGRITDAAAVDSGDAGVATTGAVTIRLRASTSKVQHLDNWSGQTPSDQKIGIRKLTLLTADASALPYVVFDHKSAAVEAGLNDKDDTLLATFSASELKAATYTQARVAISHVRYRVASSMHAFGIVASGTFNNFQVLSDGSTIDGQTWNKGHYLFAFDVNGQTYGTQTGEDGPVPQIASGAGLTLDSSGPESEYRFPVNLVVPSNLTTDVAITFEINTHENFRWQDQVVTGNQSGVFDATPTTYEPVMSFGANSFQIGAAL